MVPLNFLVGGIRRRESANATKYYSIVLTAYRVALLSYVATNATSYVATNATSYVVAPSYVVLLVATSSSVIATKYYLIVLTYGWAVLSSIATNATSCPTMSNAVTSYVVLFVTTLLITVSSSSVIATTKNRHV